MATSANAAAAAPTNNTRLNELQAEYDRLVQQRDDLVKKLEFTRKWIESNLSHGDPLKDLHKQINDKRRYFLG